MGTPQAVGVEAWPVTWSIPPVAESPKLSLIVPVHGVPFELTRAAAVAAEAAQMDGIWVPDHLVNEARPQAGVLECWTALSALAVATKEVPIGPLVLVSGFRHPPLLARQAATLEAIAPGRLRIGLGTGGFTYQATCAQLDFEERQPAARVAHCEETIRCLREHWAAGDAGSQGSLPEPALARGYPLARQSMPIILAARRPAMLRLTARMADGWNCPLPSELVTGLATIESAGRTRESIHTSVFAILVTGSNENEARRALARAGPSAQLFGDVEEHHLFGSPARLLERIHELGRNGANEITIDVRGMPAVEAIDLLSREVLPHLD